MNINWQLLTKLPYWLAKPGSELDKLRLGTIRYWQRVADVFTWLNNQQDPMQAELAIVHLLAWERDITQIPGETEQLYRTRVKYALKFAKGAGSKEGWLYMFEKLGTPWITIDERVSDTDWDVVSLQLLDSDLANSAGLIDNITRQYGRTTRRYQYDTIARLPLVAPPNDFSLDSLTGIASLNGNMQPALGLASMDNEADFIVASVIAKPIPNK